MANYSATFQAMPLGYDITFTYAFGRLSITSVGCPTDDARSYINDKRSDTTEKERSDFAEMRAYAQPVIGRYSSRDEAEAALRRHYDDRDIWLWDGTDY